LSSRLASGTAGLEASISAASAAASAAGEARDTQLHLPQYGHRSSRREIKWRLNQLSAKRHTYGRSRARQTLVARHRLGRRDSAQDELSDRGENDDDGEHGKSGSMIRRDLPALGRLYSTWMPDLSVFPSAAAR
jgi:hypothetical protein